MTRLRRGVHLAVSRSDRSLQLRVMREMTEARMRFRGGVFKELQKTRAPLKRLWSRDKVEDFALLISNEYLHSFQLQVS